MTDPIQRIVLLTTAEVCRLRSVTPSTVSRAVKAALAGKPGLRGVKLGGSYAFRVEDVEAWQPRGRAAGLLKWQADRREFYASEQLAPEEPCPRCGRLVRNAGDARLCGYCEDET